MRRKFGNIDQLDRNTSLGEGEDSSSVKGVILDVINTFISFS